MASRQAGRGEAGAAPRALWAPSWRPMPATGGPSGGTARRALPGAPRRPGTGLVEGQRECSHPPILAAQKGPPPDSPPPPRAPGGPPDTRPRAWMPTPPAPTGRTERRPAEPKAESTTTEGAVRDTDATRSPPVGRGARQGALGRQGSRTTSKPKQAGSKPSSTSGRTELAGQCTSTVQGGDGVHRARRSGGAGPATRFSCFKGP